MIKMSFTSEQLKRYKLWSCQKMCDALHYLLDNIFIRFCSKLYRQIVGIPMGTNCAPLVADLFLFCYERDYMLSLSDNNQADIIEAFKVSKVAKIRNRYNQVPHLTQDTNGKVTNSQKTPQMRAKRSALSQQVTTKHI